MSKYYSVIWSIRSKNKIDKIIEYLRVEWSEKEVNNFLNRSKNFEYIVKRFPKLFSLSEYHSKGYRKAVISKHYSVI